MRHKLKKILILTIALNSCSSNLSKSRNSLDKKVSFSTNKKNINDSLFNTVLSVKPIPNTVIDVRNTLDNYYNGKLSTHIVANRGHNNPKFGSFSFFESYEGPRKNGQVKKDELFIGYFSEKNNDNVLSIAQSFNSRLIMEVIAWDYTKKMYNFWELVGNGKTANWKYRGDSEDIKKDISDLNISPNPRFGKRLRCSACHTLGTPIMKEIEFPYNDWWTNKNKLNLGKLKLGKSNKSTEIGLASYLFNNTKDASSLSNLVKSGINKYLSNEKSNESLPKKLRSLFVPMEINLASDIIPFDKANKINIPNSFFVDPSLHNGTKLKNINISKSIYQNALIKNKSKFAPKEASGLIESYHSFLIPTRSYIDNKKVEQVINKGIISSELVADILAIDFTNPVFSKKRHSLLKYIPPTAKNSNDLQNKLVNNLKKSNETIAKELLENIINPKKNITFHKKRVVSFINKCRNREKDSKFVNDLLILASQNRDTLRSHQISENPLGQILEPGFRVIFPDNSIKSKPYKYTFSPDSCMIIEK